VDAPTGVVDKPATFVDGATGFVDKPVECLDGPTGGIEESGCVDKSVEVRRVDEPVGLVGGPA